MGEGEKVQESKAEDGGEGEDEGEDEAEDEGGQRAGGAGISPFPKNGNFQLYSF